MNFNFDVYKSIVEARMEHLKWSTYENERPKKFNRTNKKLGLNRFNPFFRTR